jgi:hypothetical protein
MRRYIGLKEEEVYHFGAVVALNSFIDSENRACRQTAEESLT